MSRILGGVRLDISGNHPAFVQSGQEGSFDLFTAAQIATGFLHPGSGAFGGQVSSGFVGGFPVGGRSGRVGDHSQGFDYRGNCPKCGRSFGWSQGDDITVRGVSGLSETWCWPCAGYQYEQGGAVRGFRTPEDVIRSLIPGGTDAPAYELADYLEDHQMYDMARFMRGQCSD